MDRRLVKIPRFNNLKIFKNGLQSISRLTANEYRDLMKVMVFVIDNLYNENINSIKILLRTQIWRKFTKNEAICIKLVDMKYLKKAI